MKGIEAVLKVAYGRAISCPVKRQPVVHVPPDQFPMPLVVARPEGSGYPPMSLKAGIVVQSGQALIRVAKVEVRLLKTKKYMS